MPNAGTSSRPLVSICIPAYNAERTLRATLDSLLAQRYPAIEIIVSDNHSTDGTAGIIAGYADRGVRACPPPPPPAPGEPSYIGAYRNADHVLRQGTGEYLCLFHADDLYGPDIVQRQVERMEQAPELGAVFARYAYRSPAGEPVRAQPPALPRKLAQTPIVRLPLLLNVVMIYGNMLPTPGVMLRRSVFAQVGGFNEQEYGTSADLDYWLRVAAFCGIGIIDEPLFGYRLSESQGGAQYNKLRTTLADMFLVLDAYQKQPGIKVSPLTRRWYATLRAADEITCAQNLCAAGRDDEARSRLGQALPTVDVSLALRRPKLFGRYAAGLMLWLAATAGVGRSAGRIVLWLTNGWHARMLQPVSPS